MNHIFTIYKILSKEFGKQNWWPVTPDGGLKPVYRPPKRLTSSQKWEIVTGAILTQNTSWKNVEKAMINLNKRSFFQNPYKFSPSEIKKMIRPSGFYNQKSKYLNNFIRYVKINYRKNLSALLSKNTSVLRNELLKINGIGAETADSIILYAAQKPTFVIDAYTLRILNRLGVTASGDYARVKTCMEENLPESVKVYSEFHALFVVLGKDFCKKKNPNCPACPLNHMCCNR